MCLVIQPTTEPPSRRASGTSPGPRVGLVVAAGIVALAAPVVAHEPSAAQRGATLSADKTEVAFELANLRSPGGLTEAHVVQRALATAPSIERAEAGVQLASAGAAQAFAGVFPRLDVRFDYTRLFNVEAQALSGGEPLTPAQIDALEAAVETVADGGRPADVASSELHAVSLQVVNALATGDAFPLPLNRYTLNAQMAWPVSRVLLEVLPAYEATRQNEEASRYTLAAERATVVLQAREAFYNYARAVGARIVAKASLVQLETQRDDIRVLVEAGSATPVELDRAESLVAAGRVALAQTRGGVRVAAVGLRVLLHDSTAELDVGTGIGEDLTRWPRTIATPQSVLVERALSDRAEIKAFVAVLRASDLQVDSARGAKLPVLSVAANLDVANPNQLIIPAIEEFRTTWSVSAVLSWSPNDYALADARQRGAAAQAAQARADLAALQDNVRLEVAQAYENCVTARESYEAAVVGIRAAEETYRVRREQLGVGTVVHTDLIQAEAELTSARLELLNAAIDARIAQAQLLRAVGAPVGRSAELSGRWR